MTTQSLDGTRGHRRRVAAVVSTLCCAGPLVAVALGLSGRRPRPRRSSRSGPYFASRVPSWRSDSASSCYEVRRSGRACPALVCSSIARRRDEVGAMDCDDRLDPLLTFVVVEVPIS